MSDPPAAEIVADRAVRLARKSHDATALAESLLRRMSVSLSPHSLADRQHALPELLKVSAASTDVPTRYFTLSTAVVASIQAGDIDQVNHLSDEADAISVSYDLAPMRWSAMVRRAWRAGLAGQHAHAEELIDEARNYGTGTAIAGALETGLMQLGLMRWQQGRVAETLPTVRYGFEELGASFPGIALVLARALASDPSGHAEAREIIATFAAGTFDELRRGTFWSSVLVLTAETARILDLPDLSRGIRDLLVPFADQVAFTGSWVTAPIAYGIGVAMAGCRDDRADRLLQRAAQFADRLQAPVLAARAREARGPRS